MRESDVVAHYVDNEARIDVSRLGGDEFTVVLNQLDSVESAGLVAERLMSALMQPMMDGSFVDRDPETIKWVPIALVGIFLVRVIGSFVSSYGMSVIGRNVIRELRREMFSRLITLPKSFYDMATTGELISKFS